MTCCCSYLCLTGLKAYSFVLWRVLKSAGYTSCCICRRVCLNRGAREKCEYEEFGGHTHLIYLTYPVTQEQTLPLGHKKKSQPHTSLCQICFPFFFSLALFFSLWPCSSKLAEHWSSAVESSESRRISNYQGTPSFYVRVHSRPVHGNNKLVLYKPLVMWGGGAVWCVCIFISTSGNNFSAFHVLPTETDCLI